MRSPCPNRQPSTRSAPAITASSAAATAVPRSLCGCTDRQTCSRRERCRPIHSKRSAWVLGGGALDGRGQVEDDLAALLGLPHVHDALADLQREVQLGVGEDLRAVLVAEDGPLVQQLLRVLHHQPGAVHGDLPDLVAGAAEDDLAEDRGRRVVQVHRGVVGALEGLHRPLDQLFAGLGEDGDRHVLGDRALLDDGAHEVEVGLARGGEADLDLLVAHPHQQVEHLALAGGGHRVDQRLVAVPQVGREPAGRRGDPVAGPGAVGQVDGLVLPVAVERHPRGALARGGGGEGGGAAHGGLRRAGGPVLLLGCHAYRLL